MKLKIVSFYINIIYSFYELKFLKILQKREIHFIFLYDFKLDHNAIETAQNVNTAFREGTTTDRTS